MTRITRQLFIDAAERLEMLLADEEWSSGSPIGLTDIVDVLKEFIPFTGVVGNAELIAGIIDGIFVIDPFDPDLVSSSSYDVRLGGNFWVAEAVGHRVDFSPYDEESVRRYYKGPYRAVTHAQWCEEHERHPFRGIGEDELIIVLKPGECILAHTGEYIGAAYGATTMMKAKSSLGRINISACDDAGWGDVGYVNRWTMEIRNKNQNVWVPLVVGMPIAQMVFFWVAGSTINYGDAGHYQVGLDLTAIKENWHPDSMLPQFYSEKNRRIRRLLLENPELVF